MRSLPPEMRTKSHHDSFRNDHAAGEIEIGPHAIGVDLQPGHESEKAGNLADAITYRVPGDFRLTEAKLVHQRRLHLEAIGPERSQGADGATEFSDQDAWTHLCQPFAVALHGSKQSSHFESE